MFLDSIVASVDKRIQELKREENRWRRQAETLDRPRSLRDALVMARQTRGMGVIAECKQRSPSKGWLTDHYDPVGQGQYYESAGASAISVLTEPQFFAGHPDHLIQVRQAVGIPVLRKDFIRDPAQIYESRALGADAVLLIVRIIEDGGRLRALYQTAQALGMDVLVEVHKETELEQAMMLEPEIVGVNNRDLDSFETVLSFSRDMAPKIPPTMVKISESGITSLEDVELLATWGYQGILVGESLMRGGKLLEELKAWRR